MISGIYNLTFFDDTYWYIGKAVDIDKRWEQHRNDFIKGKHTKKMQWAYDTYGMPQFRVHVEAHPDHLDILESIIIWDNWSDTFCLNGVRPAPVSPEDVETLSSLLDSPLIKDSTGQHLRSILKLRKDLIATRYENEQLRETGLLLPEEIRAKVTDLRKEIEFLNNRSLFQRIFNTKYQTT